MPVTNADGWIALQHRTTNPTTVKMKDTGNTYTFVPKRYAAIAWVRPEDVDALLKVQARICCGKHAPKFSYASQTNVNLWETGHR